MAVVWPSKNNFVNGDVLTAANMNNIADTLNVFNPTSATNGQVWTANGTGGGSFQSPGGPIKQGVRAVRTAGNVGTSSGTDVATGLSVTITPTSTSNFFWIVASIPTNLAKTASSNQGRGYVRIRDNTAATMVATTFVGRVWVTGTTEFTADYQHVGMSVTYAVPSLAARTFEIYLNSINASLYTLNMLADTTTPSYLTVYEVGF